MGISLLVRALFASMRHRLLIGLTAVYASVV
jgi:hypothetical protein